MTRSLLVTLALFVAIFALAQLRWSPPFPRGADAPPEIFSAARAREIQRALVEVSPRPTGSEGNARARAILLRELEKIGWKTETEPGFACGHHGGCGFVTNVIAMREGSEPAAAPVMMTAHYDAVPCSFGASDDGDGSAALVEVARAIAASPPLRRTVVALFTDGEEDGLLGAELFAREHPAARAVRATVNVDSRGGDGPSTMFETSANNGWLVDLVAKNVDRPITSSVFYEVYRRMPNDSDFTVHKRRSAGVNFANTGGIEHYHTPLDALDNADLGTLQHHGDQVLAMTRAFASADLDALAATKGDAIWFDVLAFGLVRWPERWSIPLAAIALALLIGQAIRLRIHRAPRKALLGLAVVPASLLASIAATIGVGSILRAAGALPAPWIAHPAAALICVHFASIAAGGLAGVLVARRSTPEVLFVATWVSWAGGGLALAWAMPGASYLLVVPAIAAGFAAFAPLRIACIIPAFIAAILFLPMTTPLYDALGFVVPPALALATTLLVTTLAPMLGAAPLKAARVPAAIAILALLGALLVPSYSAAHPQRVNVEFVQEGGRSRSAVSAGWTKYPWGEAPLPMVGALGGSARREIVLPWLAPGAVVDGPAIDAPPPTITKISEMKAEGRRSLSVHLASPRGAPTLVLEATPHTRSVTTIIHGFAATERWGLVFLRGVPAEGIDVDVVVDDQDPIDLVLRDATSGVPAGTPAAAAIAARPASAAQTQEGDLTILVTHARL